MQQLDCYWGKVDGKVDVKRKVLEGFLYRRVSWEAHTVCHICAVKLERPAVKRVVVLVLQQTGCQQRLSSTPGARANTCSTPTLLKE